MYEKFKINVTSNYLGNFYTTFVGVFTLPIYLEYLGVEAYGLLGFFTMLMAFIMLLDMGFSATFLREVPCLKEEKIDGYKEIRKLTQSMEMIFIIISLLILVIFFSFNDYISTEWLNVKVLSTNTVQVAINLIAILLVLRFYASLFRAGISGFEDQVWLNIFQSSIVTFRHVGGILFLMLISTNVNHLFIYQILIGVVECFFIRKKLFNYLPDTKFEISFLRSLIRVRAFITGTAYTATLWAIITQIDKLLLSHYLSLEDFGYFSMIAIIAGGILQISGPVRQALLPRMTSLYKRNNKKSMMNMYHNATKISSVIIIPVVGIVAYFSHEFVFIWTGDMEVAQRSGSVLRWYILGNGFLSMFAFQYYLQFASGDLRYHVRFYTIVFIVYPPIVFFVAKNYGMIGTSLSWLVLQVTMFIVWVPIIHNKFANGHYKKWILEDIAPSILVATTFFYLVDYLSIDLKLYDRFELLVVMASFGLMLLLITILVYLKFVLKISIFSNWIISEKK